MGGGGSMSGANQSIQANRNLRRKSRMQGRFSDRLGQQQGITGKPADYTLEERYARIKKYRLEKKYYLIFKILTIPVVLLFVVFIVWLIGVPF